MWKNEQRDRLSYLYFTRKERRASFWLLLLLLVWPTGILVWKSYFPPTFQVSGNLEFSTPPEEDTDQEVASSLSHQRFYFDPNQISPDSLRLLGFSDRAIQNLVKYRQAGGRVSSLRKIYGLSPAIANSLQTWVRIPSQEDALYPKKSFTKEKRQIVLHGSFNPNQVGIDTLLAIGFSKRAANNLVRYRQAGGVIKDSTDLRNIYGLSPAVYDQVISRLTFSTNPKKEKPPKQYSKVDINQSDSLDWVQLPGIGPYYAKRILTFREKLGGFYSIEQVGTTWKLPDSTFRKVLPFLTFSPVQNKLDINSFSAEALQKHPYINRKEAQVLVRYRENHGPFKNMEDLKKIRILSDERRNQLQPYLDFSKLDVQ